MNKIINKNKIILAITATTIAGFSVFFATAGIFKPNTQVVNDLTSGLVGYWTFDGQDTNWGASTASDKSGGGYNGAIISMSTSTSPRSGVIGQALNFNGSTSYVDVPGITSAIDPPFSIGVWIKLNSIPTGNKPILTKSGSFSIRAVATGIECIDTNTGRGAIMSLTWAVGQWYHITCVISASDLTGAGQTIYVNGSNSGAVSDGWAPSDSGTSLKIGSNDAGTSIFDGQIDEVRYYNRSLSTFEVAELYNQGAKRLTKINASQADKMTSGLTHYYTFDGPDMSGDMVYDKMSSGGINGTLQNCNVDSSKPVITIGKIGQGLNIVTNSEDDCVALASSIVTGTTFSVSMWIKPDYDGTSFLFGQGNQNAIRQGGSGRINYRYSAADHYSNNNLISVGSWSHVAVAVNSGTATFYINGVADGTALNVISMNAARIGGAGGQSSFYGSMDEVRFYNRAITQSEVTELYNQGEKDLLKVNMPQTDLIPSGLVGYWTFNGQDTSWATGITNDRSGNGYNGQIYNMSTSTSPVAGISGQALKFDGSNDYADMGNVLDFDLGNTFSFCAWFKQNDTSTNQYVLSKAISSESWGMQILSGGKIVFIIREFDDFLYRIRQLSSPSSGWKFSCGTYDGSNTIGGLKLYVNGVVDFEVLSNFGPGTSIANSSSLDIGMLATGSQYFNGSIDEVRIYNRVLTANEILEMYRAGAGL